LKAFPFTLTVNNVNDTDFIHSVEKIMMDKIETQAVEICYPLIIIHFSEIGRDYSKQSKRKDRHLFPMHLYQYRNKAYELDG